MKQIATSEPYMLHNGMGSRSQTYRHGRFIYRHIQDVNGRWSRVERGVIDPKSTDEQAAQLPTPEIKLGNKWVR